METRVKFIKPKKFKNPVVFTGLPGIGLVGKIVVDYLVKEMKAQKIAEIYSDSFPPSVQTNKGLIELIKDEIYHVNYKKQDYIFVAGPIQPSLDLRAGSMQEHYEFAEKVFLALKDCKPERIYTLAGINVGEKRMVSTPKVIVAATSKKVLEEWLHAGAISDKPEGLVSGAAGLIIGFAKENGIEGACLMGETNARLIYGDHGSAKKMIELLAAKFKFDIDMTKIEKEAKNIEEAFKELNKKFEETEDKPENGLSYVR